MTATTTRASIVGWLRRLREPRRAVCILPCALAVFVLTMTALGISGTSTSELTPGRATDGSVIIGTPRAVRSDEWLVRTPLVLGQIARDFPRDAAVGVGTHDLSVLADLPTVGWPEVFRPHQVGYFVLPPANGFAFEWWFPVAILVLGVYALVLVVFGDWRWAALAGLAMFASPYFHWWYFPSILAMVGWATGSVAAFLAALRVVRRRNRILLLGTAAYATCCFALVLYPPAQIPILYVVVVLGLAVIVPDLRDRSLRWQRLLVDLAIVGGIALLVVGLFVVTRRPALTAIANTVYPGDRRDAGGGGMPSMLFTSWFGTQYVTNDVGMRGALFANESEASGFLFLGLLVIPALPFIWQTLLAAGRRALLIVASLTAVCIGLAWYYAIGLPSFLARITLLDRTTPARVIPALGLASILLLVAVGRSLRVRVGPRWTFIAAGSVVVGLGVWMVASLGIDFRDAHAPVGRTGIVIAAAMVALVAALWFWRPLASMSALVVIGMVMVLGVHPLVDGLDQVTGTTFARAVREVDAADGWPTTWLAETWASSSVLTALGVDNLSGVNQYPIADAWRVLDPTGRYEQVWNRYSLTRWDLDPSTAAPEMSIVQDDVIQIRLDPCDPALERLHVEHLVTSVDRSVRCMVPTTTVAGPAGVDVIIWSRVD